MKNHLVLVAVAALSATPARAEQAAEAAPKTPAGATVKAAKRPLTKLPYTPSLDVTAMDRTVDPCADLYLYSCGGWKKKHPIPGDQARWGVYSKLGDEVQQYLWGMLQSAATASGRSATQQKIGDHFAACMDEAAVEKKGVLALKAELDAIAALSSKDEIGAFLGRIHPTFGGDDMAFAFGADQDPGDSTQVIAFAVAGGLGLPDRDYYLKDDAKSSEIRTRYVAHVQQMLELLGQEKAAAAAGAGAVMQLETALAGASLTRVDKRDPHKIYHRMALADLEKLTPSLRWKDYLAATGLPEPGALNVTEPAFFQQLERRMQEESLETWKTYLRFHLVRGRAPYMSKAFDRANFDFYRAYLRGVKEMQPRWKRCVQAVDRDLGEAMGQVFVEKAFPPDLKLRTLDMVDAIQTAMRERIQKLPWMGDETRQKALEKLAAMRNKIGYPDRFRDYTALTIERGDLLGNIRRAAAFETARQITKIGKPVDRGEWGMTPPTVNAYYNASMNDMNFPAGILLPPLFDARSDDAPNYGNTGSTIGHELTHGFDDEGRQFDAQGNLKDWWTEKDAAEFHKRASCVADQYAKYVVVDDIRINSKLTLGEDLADLGGTILAWEAWKSVTRGLKLDVRDGLTPEQRFFVGLAQWTCENEREENKRLNAMTNPHSPGVYRMNGAVANMPEFARAFDCKVGAPLRNDSPCQVW